MSSPLLESLVIAAAGFLSIGQILLVLVLLSSARGVKKALAYSAGMGGVLLVIGEGALLLGSRSSAEVVDSGPGFAAWGSLALGFLLVAVALQTWWRPRPSPSKGFDILASIDSTGPLKLLGFGAFMGAANVKNLAIYLSAVDVLVRARLPGVQGVLAVLLVTVVFCSCLLLPIGTALAGGRRAEPALAAFREILERSQRKLVIGVMGGFGAAFLVRAGSLFAG